MEKEKREHEPDLEVQRESEVVLKSVQKIKESGIFDQSYLDNLRFVSYGADGEPILVSLKDGAVKEARRDDSYNRLDFNLGIRDDFVGLSTSRHYKRMVSPEGWGEGVPDYKYIVLLVYNPKEFSYEEFVAHEIGHNLFDRKYHAKYGQYEVLDKDDYIEGIKVNEEYRQKMEEKIRDLLTRNGIGEEDANRFSVYKQSICEIFATIFQREYARRTGNFAHHQDVLARFKGILKDPPTAVAELKKEHKITEIGPDDVFTESHMLSYLVAPLLEKECPELKDRVNFFELD